MSEKTFGPYDIVKVKNFLPHRYPFLFVDKIHSVIPALGKDGKLEAVGTKVIGQKNATINEPYFVGHFPEMPITPGVILIETVAQISSFAMLPWLETDENLRVTSHFDLRLAGVDSTRFRRPVLPGDCLMVTSEVVKRRGPVWGFSAKGEIDGHLAMECEFLASVQFGGNQ